MKDWKDNSYHKKSKEDTEVKQTHEGEREKRRRSINR